MKKYSVPTLAFFTLAFLLWSASCGPYPKTDFRSVYYDELDLLKLKASRDSVYLKAHDYNGSVYIFKDRWTLDTVTHIISGKGKQFSPQRKLLQEGVLSISTDDIVLFETNKPLTGGANALLGPKLIISLGNAVLAGICLSVPKACFGSCPTFYTENTENVFDTKAEAFSSAISPGMEYSDIDDIHQVTNGCQPFTLFMKNEALETHLVNQAHLLAFPLDKNDVYVVHATDHLFYQVNQEKIADTIYGAVAPKREFLVEKDNLEWTSQADPEKLVTKESWILEYDADDSGQHENTGLKLTFRQTLMTTYLLYHAISYMGDEYSDYLAKMEISRSAGKRISNTFLKTLGEIEIYTQDTDGDWVFQGSFYETGPIAKNTQVCVFKHKTNRSRDGKLRVKLIYNKGLWRFDEATWVGLSHPVTPATLSPRRVFKNDWEDEAALARLMDSAGHLVSMPGDVFSIHYNMPCAAKRYQIFLDSRGYYLEWMRSNWLPDKNLKKLHNIFRNTEEWLNAETGRYKLYEQQMETDFIESRIHNENKKLLRAYTARVNGK